MVGGDQTASVRISFSLLSAVSHARALQDLQSHKELAVPTAADRPSSTPLAPLLTLLQYIYHTLRCKSTHTKFTMNANTNQAGAPTQKDDYLDKAFNAGAKKFGGAQGQKVAGNKAMSEKIVRLPALCFALL